MPAQYLAMIRTSNHQGTATRDMLTTNQHRSMVARSPITNTSTRHPDHHSSMKAINTQTAILLIRPTTDLHPKGRGTLPTAPVKATTIIPAIARVGGMNKDMIRNTVKFRTVDMPTSHDTDTMPTGRQRGRNMDTMDLQPETKSAMTIRHVAITKGREMSP